MILKLFTITVVAAAMLASQAATAGASGETIAFTCNGCHGTDGVSKGAAPKLQGMPADYQAKTLKEFKSGKKWSTIMDRIAKGYSDEELEAVAKYYESLK